jgi:hypothetical protein
LPIITNGSQNGCVNKPPCMRRTPRGLSATHRMALSFSPRQQGDGRRQRPRPLSRARRDPHTSSATCPPNARVTSSRSGPARPEDSDVQEMRAFAAGLRKGLARRHRRQHPALELRHRRAPGRPGAGRVPWLSPLDRALTVVPRRDRATPGRSGRPSLAFGASERQHFPLQARVAGSNPAAPTRYTRSECESGAA